MRIILYTGKGGVGKTSVAAATACRIASEGKKVLVMSTDAAHSLGDSFGVKLSNDPKQISDNLYAMEVDALLENERLWGSLKQYVELLFTSKAGKTIETEELLVFPGFEDLVALIRIKEIYDEGAYDALIVDCAPTGETMSLLKFPDIFKWWIEKFLPMKRKTAKVVRPVVERATKLPLPDDKAFDDFETIFDRIGQLHELLLDKDVVSIRIVTTPERIVIKEAKKSYAYLHLFDYNVDAVIINKVFSEESGDGYFHQWIGIQKQSLQEIVESFSPIPVFQLPLAKEEIRELKALQRTGQSIYGDTDPSQIYHKERIFEVRKAEAGGYELVISMPCVDRKDLDLYHKGDELSISIHNEKRSFILPEKLCSRQIQGAAHQDGHLVVRFE